MALRADEKGEWPERALFEFYLDAKEEVVRAGFIDEILWQETRTLACLTESDFLREAAWVVLSSGMAEHVIRRRFPAVSAAFHDWASAAEISADRNRCVAKALTVFGHEGKVKAIADNCERVALVGFSNVLEEIGLVGTHALELFQFIGPITSCHLAKNIGVSVAKPDRHLTRMSACIGLGDPMQLCELVASISGDSVPVVDLVFWRFATIARDYEARIANSRNRGSERIANCGV